MYRLWSPYTAARCWQVAERGLAFVKAFSDSLAAQQAAGGTQPLFRESWAFSACTALAHATLAQSVRRRAGLPAAQQHA